jgi:two-component system sensor histidine kinase KdpD
MGSAAADDEASSFVREEAAGLMAPRRLSAWLGAGAGRASGARAYSLTLAVVAACTAVAALMRSHFELSNLTMVYLLGVVISAIAFGRGPAVVASILSVALFDFGFVPPRFTFRVSDTQYLVTFAVMLVVAMVIGTLAAWLREQLEVARWRERRTAALYRLSHDLSGASTTAAVLDAARARIAELLEAGVVAQLPDASRALRFAAPAAAAAGPDDPAAARWAYENGRITGLGTQLFPTARGVHAPLEVAAQTLGVLSVYPQNAAAAPDPERMQLLRALAGQTALAVERCRLEEDAQRAWMQAETERSRSALLSSVSHDLRTPLAAITGAASSLRDDGGTLTGDTRRELAESIAEAAERLNRLIGNLLEMTRLESGALQARKEWHSLEEVVGAALTRLEGGPGRSAVQLTIPEDLPLVSLDDVLFEQVVRNLVENAQKYAPSDRPVEIEAAIERGGLRLTVADRGPGLEPGEEQRVFEKFYRGASTVRRPGVGLGLAICRGIVEAHGGTITATNRAGGGAVFTVWLPGGGEPPRVEDEPPEAASAGAS